MEITPRNIVQVEGGRYFPDNTILTVDTYRKRGRDDDRTPIGTFKVAIKDMRVYGQQWNILGEVLEINTRQRGDKIALPNAELVDRKSVLNKMFEFRYPRDRFTKVLPRDLLKDLKTSKKRKSQKVPSLLAQAARVMPTRDIRRARKYQMDPWVSPPTSSTLSKAVKGLEAVETIQKKYRKATQKRRSKSSSRSSSSRSSSRRSKRKTIRNTTPSTKSYIDLNKDSQERRFQKFLLNIHKTNPDRKTSKK